ncbi:MULTISPECIES: aliphatic sulfonate ABC transporter substrate-binding protein [unclassified Pseudomonas]|uniref:aliphatic sulfonate ABC transporter substrate-binding protein n=1 Tax=unclassified Pseudomonas TaxID=196821 RepID=UPI00095FAF7E|nr:MULTISPECIES: aliphatic sulfonate ABC transporter substrate-binding protein [unclassified Pseudomonas]OLU16859.1 sulfonate ABC transporter substrate-binding protein [Pseudomonas sp. PA1(2017)]OLU36042.1 sulfonate ABC transporter substrate-binding protein [Pseudomonas sp. PA27(2017)]
MKKTALRVGLAALFAAWLPIAAYAAPPREVRLDYAYYAPTSLVLKQQGLLEKALEPQGISVKWVFSQGSNRSLEYLNGGSTDFASTAGLAAVLSRANGAPIKTVYVASRPEWTALVVPKDSPIQTVADLKGKKVAATKGTDPFLFLLQSLQKAGLNKNDVEIVHLQHPDGRVALERGDVQAWAGLDPLMASSELQAGSRLLYRNRDFNSYSVLSVTETFAKQQPALIEQVIAAYEQARQWAIANPDALAQLLAEEAKLPLEVAKLQLSRTDFSNSQPGAEHINALKAAAPILLEEGLVRPGTDVAGVVDQLITPQLAAKVIARSVAKAGN